VTGAGVPHPDHEARTSQLALRAGNLQEANPFPFSSLDEAEKNPERPVDEGPNSVAVRRDAT